MKIHEALWLWGPLFRHSLPQALKQLNQPCDHLAVDGGALVRPLLPPQMIQSWWAIGDGDSLDAKDLDQVYPQNKDRSDLGLALDQPQCLAASHWRAIGFCGGRDDHHLIGLSRFFHALEQSHTAKQAWLDENWLMMSPGTWRGSLASGTVSVLSLWENKITLSGDWRWPLNNKTTVPFDDLLLSNQTGGNVLEVISKHAFLIWSEKPILDWWQFQ